ncbi:MAG: hypothetical protein C0404_12650, partial [Verrucomicrobia bacterium]|nr:hypothetical protein [Verrucomicrobiota bacterium]
MTKLTKKTIKRTILLFVGCLVAGGVAHGADFYLRTGVITNVMPDGRSVVMWAFAQDTAFEARNGTLTVPGPALTMPPGDSNLTIHLDNDLPEPVSIVIPGLISTISPVPSRMGDGRATSFTHEAAPGNVAPENYGWTNVAAGTHLYFSGSHSAVQVQMGLYGAIKRDAAAGQAYAGVPYSRDVTLLFSEIDPALHDAVADGTYGPGEAMTSTVDYLPKYFLINGVSYTNGLLHISAGVAGDKILLRILNAGLGLRTPTLNGAYAQLVAEDGNKLPYPRQTYTVPLPPLTTMDAILTASTAQSLAIYDRRLGLVNGTNSPGGMLAYLDVNMNLLLPANGGMLRSYTSQYSGAYAAAKLTDGAMGAAYYWLSSASPAVPQSFVYTFSNNSPATLSQAVVYNYGEGTRNRYSKGFHIDVSSD